MKPPTIPNPFEKGQVLTAAQLEALRQACLYAIQTGVIAGPGLVSSLMGNQTVLALQRRPSRQGDRKYWPITQASTDPLDINIGGGPVHLWDGTNVRPTQADVPATSTPLSLTASSTNYVYLQATMTPVAYGSLYTIWVASAFDFYTATSEEANTADFEDSATGNGEIFLKLGEVTTDGSAITDITPIQTTLINLLWPWTTPDGSFTCPP